MIVVAERIASIMDADQILVLNDGRLEAQGTHARTAPDLPDLPRDSRVPARHERAAMRGVLQ